MPPGVYIRTQKIKDSLKRAHRKHVVYFLDICHCGKCNEITYGNKQFIWGHNVKTEKKNFPSFKSRHHTIKSKEKMRKNHKGKHISLSTEWKKGREHPFYGLYGEKSFTWKGGRTALQKIIRESEFYDRWRTEVFLRDEYTCQKCDVKGGSLNSHHIVPFSSIIISNNIKSMEDAINCQELWDVKNGLTLCEKCHKHFTPPKHREALYIE